MKVTTRWTALGVSAVALVGLTGCAGAASASQTGTSSAPKSGTATTAVEPLVLYAAEGFDSVAAKAFTAKTGIPVNLVDDSTGPLLTKIQAEKNNPQWSLLWVDGDTAFSALDQQGMLATYAAKGDFNDVGKAIIPSDHSYTPTGTTVMSALIYNAAKTTAVPATYDDLLGSAYTGKVGMNDPAQSGPTYPFIAGLMNQLGDKTGGVTAGEAYLTKLKANGLHVFPTNGDTLHALETGQIDYGLIQSSAAIGEALKVKPTADFEPKIAYLPKSTLLPSVIGIDKGASAVQQEEAKKFIDYVVSPEGQAVMLTGDPTGDSLFWHVVNGTKSLPGLPAFPTAYQSIDPAFWGPLQSQVVTWFESNIK
jgi:iron(III) transport system substrate-binding protein